MWKTKFMMMLTDIDHPCYQPTLMSCFVFANAKLINLTVFVENKRILTKWA